jgi:indolepyruvate ferredoxin oxidoreductase alpha subunit
MMKKLLSGDEAVAYGAWRAGVKFASAYPGTPSTEILEAFARLPGIYAEWAPNEKVAVEVGIGSALAGVRTLVTMKHVGVNVAADPLMTFTYTGLNAGFVLVSADDPEMHSSQNEQDNRIFARFAGMPLLEPSDSQEAYDYVAYAYELSEKYDLPVMLRVTTRLAHSKTVVEMQEEALEAAKRTFRRDIKKYVMMPIFAIPRHRALLERLVAVQAESEKSPLQKIEMQDSELGVITSGVAYQYARELLPTASFLKLGLTHPLPVEMIRHFTQRVKRLLVIEELEPYLEEQIQALGIRCEGKRITSRLGELTPERLAAALEKAGIKAAFSGIPATPLPTLGRPPVLCPGCAHRAVFTALKATGAHVFGDIGCYTLAALPPLEMVHTCFCMGASIGNAVGAAKAGATEKPIAAVIGDSTFVHSGITGLVEAVYNNARVTVIIVDNGITAMTGGQDHPATGKTLMGTEAARLNLETLCKAVGVKYVWRMSPLELDEFEKTLRESYKTDGPAVIIAEQPCQLYPTRQERAPMVVDAELCNGCGACLRVGCPALLVTMELSSEGLPKVAIDHELCTGCEVCAWVCKPTAIKFPTTEEVASE